MELNEPIFQKTMSKTDVRYRLSVPSAAFHDHFPSIFHGNSVNIRVRYGNGLEEWTLPCFIRGGANYDKPVIAGEWHRIASDKGFSEGDLLRFFKEQDHQGRRVYRFEVYTEEIVNEMGEKAWVLIP